MVDQMIFDQFEPGSIEDIEIPGGETIRGVNTQISIAISLKRIADATERLAQPIAEQIVAGLTAPINSYGEGIGDAIQGQMIRGQRGIDQYEG